MQQGTFLIINTLFWSNKQPMIERSEQWYSIQSEFNSFDESTGSCDWNTQKSLEHFCFNERCTRNDMRHCQIFEKFRLKTTIKMNMFSNKISISFDKAQALNVRETVECDFLLCTCEINMAKSYPHPECHIIQCHVNTAIYILSRDHAMYSKQKRGINVRYVQLIN